MLLLKLITVLLTAIDVQVDLLDGTSKTGTLASISPEMLTLSIDGQDQSIPLNDIIGVTGNNVPANPSGDTQGHLMLADGSRINCTPGTLTARDIVAESATIGSLTIPRSSVRAVQLNPANPAWEDAWQAFLERDDQDDLLILKKRDGSGLDFYGGVVSASTDDKVDFILDGDTVPVPRTRIYGLIFNAGSEHSNSPVSIQLNDGTQIMSAGLTTADDVVQAQTSWQQMLRIPVAVIHSIDFSRGRFHYLSDLEPVNETYYGIHPKGSLLEKLLQGDDVLSEEARNLWKMHRDEIPMGPLGPLPLTLRGRVYPKGIWLFPHCRIDYALDGRYAMLQAMVGVDDEVAFNCSDQNHPSKVALKILADGDEVTQELIEAPADPIAINLDVTGIQTLSVIVDFGDDDSACDFLDLADARLLLVP